jgi:hypothetical protein
MRKLLRLFNRRVHSGVVMTIFSVLSLAVLLETQHVSKQYDIQFANFSTFASTTSTLATNCTLYASPTGNDGNNGTSPSTPKTLRGVATITNPGSVVCLLPGQYDLNGGPLYITRSGLPASWVTYMNYDTSNPAEIIQTNTTVHDDMFQVRALYTEINGLRFDGRNNAEVGIKCQGTSAASVVHHVRMMGNFVKNAGAAGLGSKWCDYLTADKNMIWHNGYHEGWSSGITFNSQQWSDQYTGFHTFVTNNIISGSFDGSTNHTDGNGIIMDLSNGTYDTSTANTPPALIANNLVYENGGDCIQEYVVTNIWIVNNTCYKNTLDTTLGANHPEFNASKSKVGLHGGYFVNNIAYALNSSHPSYACANSGDATACSQFKYNSNLYYNGPLSGIPSSSLRMLNANPLFASVPNPDGIVDGQGNAPSPETIGHTFYLQATSPAIDYGIDPTTLTANTDIIAGLRQYLATDLAGNQRPNGTAWDLGAYEYISGITPTTTLPPTNTAAPTLIVTATSTPIPTFTPTSGPTDTTLPVVNITYPTNGTVVARRSDVTIAASASDNVGVTKVVFYINNNVTCTDTAAPYTCGWTVPSNRSRTYTIVAKAYDAANNIGTNTVVVTSN